jgi:hypothetical protein
VDNLEERLAKIVLAILAVVIFNPAGVVGGGSELSYSRWAPAGAAHALLAVTVPDPCKISPQGRERNCQTYSGNVKEVFSSQNGT